MMGFAVSFCRVIIISGLPGWRDFFRATRTGRSRSGAGGRCMKARGLTGYPLDRYLVVVRF